MEFLHTKDGQFFAGGTPVLLRGVGLGGWLLPEGYMWRSSGACDRPRRMEEMIRSLCGEEYAGRFWKRYFDRFITEKDIAWLAAQGFNSVRLAMNARKLFSVDANGTVRSIPEGLSYVDACLAWCEKYGIYLFLDMHAAPGGQTGRNIDDSERDMPELFTDPANQDALTAMWIMLAERYRNESAIGGYDLLNEPLPRPDGAAYDDQLLPLYLRLTETIRGTGDGHIIVWEGLHWATDLSLFDAVLPGGIGDDIALEFHKYWNDPDWESIGEHIRAARRLNVPLWMGEGGENNLDWYTAAFPMLERHGVGWCFWCFKKMVTANSPATFPEPENWQWLWEHLDGKRALDAETARGIFDELLRCLEQTEYHPEVVNALMRRPPVEIPSWAYDAEDIVSERQDGAAFRRESRASLIFADGHTGPVNWAQTGGEQMKEDERPLLRLGPGDRVGYRVLAQAPVEVEVYTYHDLSGQLLIQGKRAGANGKWTVYPDLDGLVWLLCENGQADIRCVKVLTVY